MSAIPVPAGSDFPIENLPFGVFRPRRGTPRVGVAVGDHVVDLAALVAAGTLPADLQPHVEVRELNGLMASGRLEPTRRAVKTWLEDDAVPGTERDAAVHRAGDVELLLPVSVGDYVDFYSSIHHATNVGRLFRPDDPPLLPNWRHLPVGYHGRASTVVVTGTDVVRPNGQYRLPGSEGPTFGPSRKLDFELEVGFVTAAGNALGHPIPIRDAERHIGGLVLVNDWSARDIQAWEYRPLGPFLGKSFATTVSPWVVTLEALAPFRVPAPPQDPGPLPYLQDDPHLGLDLHLEVEVNGTVVCRTDFRDMYWTMAQQLTHAASNGTAIRPGDLYASGTVSGPDEGTYGSLLEATRNGAHPLSLADGSRRTFLEDGDEVVIRGWCGGDGRPRIGFGECRGRVLPAPPDPPPG